MKRTVFLTALVAVFMIGCSSSEQAADESPASHNHADGTVHEGDHAQTASAGTEMQVELGCAMCTYHMEGAAGCQTAAKVGDETMVVTGADINAHALGLCAAPKNATVTGTVEDGQLVATSYAFTE